MINSRFLLPLPQKLMMSVSRATKKAVQCGEFSGHQSVQSQDVSFAEPHSKSNMFNSLCPQVIGYTRGKLHELVIKSYKSRGFAAVINAVLYPWINARQPKKEFEKQIYIGNQVTIYFLKFTTIPVFVSNSYEDMICALSSLILSNYCLLNL